MFAVQVLVPVILAPLIFEEKLVDDAARRRRPGRGSCGGARRHHAAGRLAGGRRGDRVRACRAIEPSTMRVFAPLSLLALRPPSATEPVNFRRGTPQSHHPRSHRRAPQRQPGLTRPSSRSGSTTATVPGSSSSGPRCSTPSSGPRAPSWRPSSSAGQSGTGCPASASRAGPAARWRRSSSPASRGETVLCPSNTFMATPLAAIGAGAEVEFVDCNRSDLCMSFEDFERKAERHKPRAAILVHIGGHIAFDAERDRRLLPRQRDLPARGLRPRPRRRLERRTPRRLRRRRRLLALRDQDGLHRRGRRPRLRQR